MDLIDFLNWLSKAGGIVAILIAALGYLFREKWKQILQRSLSSDLERLKAELARSHAEHAASLTPQLEQIKHDFQARLEAYKVSLIAEAEATKAQTELRKSIALRYSEIEFERLVKLELVVAPLASDMLARGMVDPATKTVESAGEMVNATRALGRATEEAEMFLPEELHREVLNFRTQLIGYWQAHLGPGKSTSAPGQLLHDAVMKSAATVHHALKAQIKKLGLPPGTR